ncbi:MAG TPA: ParB/RepB/Spo0J family partition protein [Gemmatimonadales bacterium]|nr:ParB/RepB/Spo0J family partition protein [Gemmatimonadales bacterium]
MTPPPDRTRRLGKGLGALLSSNTTLENRANETSAPQALPIDKIRPNPYQPRKEFRPEDLADLEASLRSSGLLQPITVRPSPSGTGYELIAGERRFRAASRLGWKEIPAIVREIDERTLLTLALVENLQRADLNPLEEAEGYQKLADDFDLSQQEIADAVGKDRSTVANLLRLLALPASVKRLIQEGQLSAGHGRALLGLPSEMAIQELARTATQQQLSVRETERRVRNSTSPKSAPKSNTTKPDKRPAEVRRIEAELRQLLQTDVNIALTKEDSGRITLNFYSTDDFQRITDQILGAE